MNQQELDKFKLYLDSMIDEQGVLSKWFREYGADSGELKHLYCLRILTGIRGAFERGIELSEHFQFKTGENDD